VGIQSHRDVRITVTPPLSFSNLIICELSLHCSQAQMSVISGDRFWIRDLKIYNATISTTGSKFHLDNER
jgi:hypothetical protein